MACDPETPKSTVLLQRVQAICPELEAQTARLLEGGITNDVLIVDEAYVFLFPRTAGGVERLKSALVVLRALQGHTSVPVPDPQFISPDLNAVGKAFFGYRMLSGDPLRQHLAAIGQGDSRQLADQLALFLRELHTFPIQALSGDLPAHDQGRREALPALHENIRRHLYPHMRPDAQEMVSGRFDAFLGVPSGGSYRLAIKHGDLGPGNILVDPQTLAVSGVIDFGSTGLDDPAVDLGFVSFWGTAYLGEAFVDRLLASYGASEALLERLRFYETVIALSVALEGLQSDDQETLEFGLARYR